MKNKLLEILGIEKIINSVQGLIETRVALIKEEIEEKVALTMAKAIPLLLAFFAVFLFVLFGSITLGIYLSQLMNSYIAGFGILTGVYFLLAVFLFLIKDNKAYNKNFYDQVKKRK